MTPVNARRIEVGDQVVVVAGRIRIPGRVVEDRGNLGVGGARVLGLRTDMGEGAENRYSEAPEYKLELVEPDA
jgi:hypothetical protein